VEFDYRTRNLDAAMSFETEGGIPSWLYSELLEDQAGWTPQTFDRWKNEGNTLDDLMSLIDSQARVQRIKKTGKREGDMKVYISSPMLNQLRKYAGTGVRRQRRLTVPPLAPRQIA